MRRLLSPAYVAAAVAAMGCSFDWDAFDPRESSATTTTSGSTSVGGAGAGAGGRGGAPSSGGMGGAPGGFGGQLPTVLVDRGLTTRFYIDEANSGRDPGNLVDAAPDPITLQLDYGDLTPSTGGAGGAGGMSPSGIGGALPNWEWAEENGHRGILSSTKNRSGSAKTSVSADKLSALDGLTEATIECVARIEDTGGNGTETGRLSHFGVNNWGTLTLSAPASGFSFRLNGREVETWSADLSSLGRFVVHGVLDTSLAADARVRLYVNGAESATTTSETPPDPDEAIAISNGNYVLGNRNGEDRSFAGMLFYCALYSVALTPREVAANAIVLGMSDDSP